MPENYSDLAIPEIKLVQNSGGSEAKSFGALPGDFYCSLTQEIIKGAEGFDIIVAGPIQKTRTYWATEEIKDEPPVCASQDGVTSINGDVCISACPHSAYNDAPYMLDKSERRMKCVPNFHVVAIKVDDMMPVLIRCSGVSAQAAKELKSLLVFHKAIRGQYYRAKIHVGSVAKKTSFGDIFAIKFGNPTPLDTATIAEVKEQIALLSGVELPALTEATEGPKERFDSQTAKPQTEHLVPPKPEAPRTEMPEMNF
jgi:hypothetical protein